MLLIFVTLEVSQVLISSSKEVDVANWLKSSIPEVHVVARPGVVEMLFIIASRPALSRFVYVTPFTIPVALTVASGQRIVTPFGAKEKPSFAQTDVANTKRGE